MQIYHTWVFPNLFLTSSRFIRIKTACKRHLQCPGRTWVNPQRDMAAHDVDTNSRVGPPTRAVGSLVGVGVGMPRISWNQETVEIPWIMMCKFVWGLFFWVGILKLTRGLALTSWTDWSSPWQKCFFATHGIFVLGWEIFWRVFGIWGRTKKSRPIFRIADPHTKFWNFFFFTKNEEKCLQQKKGCNMMNSWLLGSFKKLHQGLATAKCLRSRKLRLNTNQYRTCCLTTFTQFVMFFVLRGLFSDRKTPKNMGKYRTD